MAAVVVAASLVGSRSVAKNGKSRSRHDCYDDVDVFWSFCVRSVGGSAAGTTLFPSSWILYDTIVRKSQSDIPRKRT